MKSWMPIVIKSVSKCLVMWSITSEKIACVPEVPDWAWNEFVKCGMTISKRIGKIAKLMPELRRMEPRPEMPRRFFGLSQM